MFLKCVKEELPYFGQGPVGSSHNDVMNVPSCAGAVGYLHFVFLLFLVFCTMFNKCLFCVLYC